VPAKYRVAVIGHTGRGNYGHGIDTVWLQLPECEIVGVADADEPGLAAAVTRLSAPQGYADYRRMLDEAKPDIVAIGPRWLDQHRDMVLAAAERGMHVYMEKPMCRTLEEADEIAAACEKHDIKLAVAHQTRYSPKLHVISDMIYDGRIGKVLELRGRGKEDGRGGGEDLWVLGSHVMNLMHHFGGEPNWCMANVTQGGQPVGKGHVADGPEGIGPLAGDSLSAMYGMNDGVTAYFASTRNMGAGKRFGLQILGSEGIIEVLTGYLPAVNYLADPSWSPGVGSRQFWRSRSARTVTRRRPKRRKRACLPRSAGRYRGRSLAGVQRLRRTRDRRNDRSDLRITSARQGRRNAAEEPQESADDAVMQQLGISSILLKLTTPCVVRS